VEVNYACSKFGGFITNRYGTCGAQPAALAARNTGVMQQIALAVSGNAKRGKYHCTVDLLFDWFGICCMTIDNFCFYLQIRLIQTSQTGGQQYSDTSPFSIPWQCA
jgi:hypothetical protein